MRIRATLPATLAVLLASCQDSTSASNANDADRACPGMVLGQHVTQTALPSGACSGDAPCRATVADTCSDGTMGQIREYVCSCLSDGWSCVVTSTSKNACKPPSADSGSD